MGGVVVPAVALFRGIEIGRVFVNSTYRRRAIWVSAFLLVVLVSNVISLVPGLSNSVYSGLYFFAFYVVVLAFVDTVISVAKETDFFHREVIHWARLRPAVYVAILASIALSLTSLFIIPPFSSTFPPSDTALWLQLAFDQNYIVPPIIFAYAAIALIIGARRTPDSTLKRHIRLLGIALALFVATVVVSTPGTELSNLLAGVVGDVSLIFLYLSVMALSPVGRIGALEAASITTAGPLTAGTH